MHIVLYQPEIPQNTGNIGRTCVALGAKLWIVRPTGFSLDSGRLKRAGLDYWQDLDWESVDHWEMLESKLDISQAWFLSKFGKKDYLDSSVQFHSDTILVFGRETSGLPESFHARFSDRMLSIPMPGPVRSLNLAVSVGIVAYEVYRQSRQIPSTP